MRIESTRQSPQAEPESGSWVAINSSPSTTAPTSAAATATATGAAIVAAAAHTNGPETDSDTASEAPRRLGRDDDDFEEVEVIEDGDDGPQQHDSQSCRGDPSPDLRDSAACHLPSPRPTASPRPNHPTRSRSRSDSETSIVNTMSEDGYDSAEALQGAGHPSSGSGRHHTPNQRKGPRFSWTPAYEATFFRSLCESVKIGLKDNHSFKSEAWDRACTALAKHHSAYPNKGHLINKSDNARKKFRLWRGLREDPEFLYNPNTKTVTASDEAWRSHIEVSGTFFSS